MPARKADERQWGDMGVDQPMTCEADPVAQSEIGEVACAVDPRSRPPPSGGGGHGRTLLTSGVKTWWAIGSWVEPDARTGGPDDRTDPGAMPDCLSAIVGLRTRLAMSHT